MHYSRKLLYVLLCVINQRPPAITAITDDMYAMELGTVCERRRSLLTDSVRYYAFIAYLQRTVPASSSTACMFMQLR
jgi:hypothetical protein